MSNEQGEDTPPTGTVRLDNELIRMARVVCAHSPGRPGKQLKLVDYLDSLLRNRITEDYQRIMDEIVEAQKTTKKPKGG